jgi:hypothetical protein
MEIITVIPEIKQSDLFVFIPHIIPVHGKTVEKIFRTSDFASHISHSAYTIKNQWINDVYRNTLVV